MMGHKQAEIIFERPVGNYCQWPGTETIGKGTNTIRLPCGEIAVGKGMFCSPTHNMCSAMDLCERHADRPIEDWEEVDNSNAVWGW